MPSTELEVLFTPGHPPRRVVEQGSGLVDRLVGEATLTKVVFDVSLALEIESFQLEIQDATIRSIKTRPKIMPGMTVRLSFMPSFAYTFRIRGMPAW